MSENDDRTPRQSPAAKGARTAASYAALALSALLPLVVLGAMVYWFLDRGTGLVERPTPPVESISFERMVLGEGMITAYVRNTGPLDVTVAQVTVNDALWGARIEPADVIPRLGRAAIVIPYDWVEGEPYEIGVITSTGLRFSGTVEVAATTPVPSLRQAGAFALLGLYVGVIPVYLGLLWFPFLRRLSPGWIEFFLSLTAGLLVFLGVDALEEALEIGGRLPSALQATGVIVLGAVASFLVLLTAGRITMGGGAASRGASHTRLALAYMIALGIGLHNLGEGLAIGSAYAVGEVAVGAFLVIGFTVHNITEGLGIVSPIAQGRRPGGVHFLWLGLLAGVPTVFGTWIGGFTYSDLWATLFFAVGTGAIFQVVYEIAKLIGKRTEGGVGDARNLAGFVLGMAVMYVTGLFVIV